VTDPGTSTTWRTAKVLAYWDQNGNIGATSLNEPNGPGASSGGYETLVFDQGTNRLSGSPGGSTAILMRIPPDRAASIELAVSRTFLAAMNGGASISQAAFRPFAGKGTASNSNFYLHDYFSRSQAGSPYPWLQQSGAPATCLNSGLTTAQRDALESGTNTNTGINNPCYPNSGLYEMDSSGQVGVYSSASVTLSVDMQGVLAALPTSASVTDTVSFNATITNLASGTGNATGVQASFTLPSATFVSATPSSGSCGVSGSSLSCSLGTVANGASRTIAIRMLAPATGPMIMTGTVTADPADPNTANNSMSADVTVVPLSLTITPQGGTPRERQPGPTSYKETFTVAYGAASTRTLQLAASVNPAVLALDSLGGALLTPGATISTGSISSLAPGTATQVDVWYRVLNSSDGATSPIRLNVTLPNLPTDSGWVSVLVIRRADVTLSASVDRTAPAFVGEDLTYTFTLGNQGTADAESVVLDNPVPATLSFKIGSQISSLGGIPVTFELSSDDGLSWNYSPVSGGCSAPAGYDACVNRVRWRLGAALPVGGAGGTVSYVAQVR
jgi:uncharacterized repeat protein (TIGR01451 family)